MNAIARDVAVAETARAQLEAWRQHREGLVAKLAGPTARCAAAQRIIDEARDAEALAEEASRAWNVLEQRRLVGDLVDVKALKAAETRLTEATAAAEVARRKAVPAAAAVAELSVGMNSLQAEMAAEDVRAIMLRRAVLIEEGIAGLESFREAVAAFAEAWTRAMTGFYAADVMAERHPELKLPPVLGLMLARFDVPMPMNVAGVKPGYISLDGQLLDRLAREALERVAAI